VNAPEKIPSVRVRLRAATDGIHQALHLAAPFAAIADGTVTRGGYGDTLLFLHRYHSAMMPLCHIGADALGLPQLAEAQAARIQALEYDLAHMELVPEVAPAVETGGAGFCIGALYTVLGSTLGGKLIFRQIDALLPDIEGRTFFRGAPDDARNWQALCAALETQGEAFEEVEAGALFAFTEFRRLLG